MERKRLTLSQAARESGLGLEEIRCAIVAGHLLGEISENTGIFMIDAKSLEAYMKAHHGVATGDPRRRVLIIDDEINFGNLIKLDLQRDARITARFASWGRDGVRLAGEFKPHLILLDLMLPDATGTEMLQELQQLRRASGTKVLAYSAHVEQAIQGDPSLSARLQRFGADGFVSKTVGLRVLVARVKELLGLGPAQAGAA